MHSYKNNLERRGKHDIAIPSVISLMPSSKNLTQPSNPSSLSQNPKIPKPIRGSAKKKAQLQMLTLHLPNVNRHSHNTVTKSQEPIKTNRSIKTRKFNQNISYHQDYFLSTYIPRNYFTKTQEDIFRRNIKRRSLGDYVKVLNTFYIPKHS